MTPTLRQLVSAAADGAADNFRRMGWAAPVLFVVDAAGRLHMNLLVIEGPADREAAPYAARDIISDLGGVIYVTVAEVWGKAVPADGRLSPTELADDMLG